VKAPATRTAKSTKTVSTAAKGRAEPTKKPAKPAVKAAAKPVVKKAPVNKPAAKAPSNAAAKAKVPAPPVTKPAGKPAAKPAAKAPVKAVTKPAAKVGKAPVAATKTPAKPVPASKPAVKPAPVKVAPAKPVPAPRAPSPARPAPAPVAVVPETPVRASGKRAIKKAMMEQMSQATTQPTHAPDAPKATFFTMNQRVMTPTAPPSIQKDPKRANNWKKLSVEELADQDITAMPDTEYMNEVQLAFFRRKLTQLKADMLANAGETTEHLREDTVVVPDPADRATIEEEHALELRTRDRERKLLKKIEQAIARIDSGDYGYCEETGEPIGVGRLMARPTASLSLEAQQRRELKQKMFGD
jgi:DnaK suppressor protein